jgi:hypothetical protein
MQGENKRAYATRKKSKNTSRHFPNRQRGILDPKMAKDWICE